MRRWRFGFNASSGSAGRGPVSSWAVALVDREIAHSSGSIGCETSDNGTRRLRRIGDWCGRVAVIEWELHIRVLDEVSRYCIWTRLERVREPADVGKVASEDMRGGQCVNACASGEMCDSELKYDIRQARDVDEPIGRSQAMSVKAPFTGERV